MYGHCVRVCADVLLPSASNCTTSITHPTIVDIESHAHNRKSIVSEIVWYCQKQFIYVLKCNVGLLVVGPSLLQAVSEIRLCYLTFDMRKYLKLTIFK